MRTVLIIGAGSMGRVVAQKCNRIPSVFSKICLASRSVAQCEAIKQSVGNSEIEVASVNAENTHEVVALIRKYQPQLVIHAALPQHNLPIMEACLQSGANYLDTGCADSSDDGSVDFQAQQQYHEHFQERGIMALLSCGFDPGLASAYCRHAQNHLFDEIEQIDLLSMNGDGVPLANNFNPDLHFREVQMPGRFWESGQWHSCPSLSQQQSFDFPQVGQRDAYLVDHEALHALQRHIPGVQSIRYWMAFSKSFLTHLDVLKNIGMASSRPVEFGGQSIVPRQFLKAVLPHVSESETPPHVQMSVGCIVEGLKDEQKKRYHIHSAYDAEKCSETGIRTMACLAGVSTMVGAKLMLQGRWQGEGVFNIEQFDPDPFLKELEEHGVSYQENAL